MASAVDIGLAHHDGGGISDDRLGRLGTSYGQL